MSESFKSVAKGISKIFQKVYLGCNNPSCQERVNQKQSLKSFSRNEEKTKRQQQYSPWTLTNTLLEAV